MLLNIRKLKKF